MKIQLRINWFKVFIILVFIIGLLSASVMAATNTPTWIEHPDVVSIAVLILVSLVGWFLIRLIAKMDKNQEILFNMINELKSRFDHLEGEHDAIKERCGK